jgi:hypothetical protein
MSISEVTVIIKDDEKSLRKKHLIYEAYCVDEHDPIIASCLRETEKEFEGEATDIQIKITMTVK